MQGKGPFGAMRALSLTVPAAFTFWGIAYVLLDTFAGDHPDFPGQNILEFVVNSALLLMVGWMVVAAVYATGGFKISQRTAFTTCVLTMAVFAYSIASGTYKKILQPPTPLQKKFDRFPPLQELPQVSGMSDRLINCVKIVSDEMASRPHRTDFLDAFVGEPGLRSS